MIIDPLDNDLQKFLIGEILFDNPNYGDLEAEFTLISRDDQPLLLPDYIQEMRDTNTRIYVNNLDFHALNKLGFSRQFSHNLDQLGYDFDQLKIENGELKAVGPWKNITFWEVPLMYLESRLRAQKTLIRKNNIPSANEYAENTRKKIKAIPNCNIVESGTRRRFSYEYQKRYIDFCSDLPNFMGTSNVKIAHELGLTTYGSIGHELYMGLAALDTPTFGTARALRLIKKQDKSRIALTDTFTTDFFIKVFMDQIVLLPDYPEWQKYFHTFRQDSGNAISIGNKLIEWQRGMNVSPSIIFSNGLNGKEINNIQSFFDGCADMTFGPGTWLSNDMSEWQEYRPPNLVCKLTKLDGKPVVKLSDEPDKATGDKEQIEKVKNYVSTF